ncbi:UDP-N-acetylglucosamine 1-carboxyvinyltransferase [Kitasatospora sp. NPDC059747]|uniref:UDP-N-acetylglucosamine 1-carboxyvinyltransferase n=1 Tax=Kitasatospora sp. NPDC059747 TaxID=3346930 RepID=UPI0036682068
MTTTTTTGRLALRITGGHPLHGSTTIQGSKNIALHLYAATILADQPLTLTGSPAILDTGVCAEILHRTGTRATITGDEFETRPADSYFPVIPDDLGRRIRTTAVMAAALLTRTGKVALPLPGGDAFCARYIDLHLAAMEAPGAKVRVDRARVRARFTGAKRRPFITTASSRKWGPSLGATVTAVLLAARTPGTSSILSPSIEPEVTATADLLARSGVGVIWQGTEALNVTGTDHITGGTFPPSGFPAGLVSVFADAGILLTAERGGTTVAAPDGLRAVETATGPHPGYPTDVQPQLTAALTQAAGTSRIDDRVYTRRDSHLGALRKFGAVVNAEGSVITVEGPSRLVAAEVAGEDIRAVTTLVLAALTAEGTSTIRGIYHLQRGYGDLLPKLASLGAELTINQEAP